MKRKTSLCLEPLEDRLCLAVLVSVENGDLKVEGAPDGGVQIVADDEDTYRVLDNGVETVVDGVTDDIRIDLRDADPSLPGSVTIDLSGQSVDRIMVKLGDGDNSLSILGGTASSIYVRSGVGSDTVDLGSSLSVGRSVFLRLGGGGSDVNVDAEIERALKVHGGDGVDDVTIGADAVIGRVAAYLGADDDVFTLLGQVDYGVSVRAGAGADAVITDAASAAGSLRLHLGDGDNVADLSGAVAGRTKVVAGDGSDQVTLLAGAQLDSNLLLRLGDGDDVVVTEAESNVGGDAVVGLGDGENSLTHHGNIDGTLVVRSGNPDDQVDINGTAGEVNSQPGTELELEDHFHVGRHRFPGFGYGYRGFPGLRMLMSMLNMFGFHR